MPSRENIVDISTHRDQEAHKRTHNINECKQWQKVLQ